jgi:hypothetical protein
MADYDLKVISADADGPASDNSVLFGADDQSSATPKPYTFGGIKAWIAGLFAKKPVGFRATKGGTDQVGIPNSNFTAVSFGTEDYDQGNYFSSDAWTPPAGLVNLQVSLLSYASNQVAGGLFIGSIFKNGVRFKDNYELAFSAGVSYSCDINLWDVANGTDVYSVQVNVATNGGTTALSGGTTHTYFSGTCFPS